MDDLGGIEDLTDEGIAKFLQENIGDEFDQEFLEEFRSSDLFDEFVKQLQPNQINSPSSSRRASVASEVESRPSTNNNDGEPRPSRQAESAGPSTSKDSLGRRNTNCDSSRHQKKKKSPIKPSTDVRPANIQQQREIPKTESKQKGVDKNIQPEYSKKERGNAAAQMPKKKKPSHSVRFEDDYSSNDRRQEKSERDMDRKNRFADIRLTLEKPIVRMYDLIMMKSHFPTGLSHVVLTPQLLKQIRSIEREVISAEVCKKLQLSSRNKAATAEGNSKKSTKLEPVKSSTSTNVKTKINQVLENVQLFQGTSSPEKKKQSGGESSGSKEAKSSIDKPSKVLPNTKSTGGSNASDTARLGWAHIQNPLKKIKPGKNSSSLPTSHRTPLTPREHTDTPPQHPPTDTSLELKNKSKPAETTSQSKTISKDLEKLPHKPTHKKNSSSLPNLHLTQRENIDPPQKPSSTETSLELKRKSKPADTTGPSNVVSKPTPTSSSLPTLHNTDTSTQPSMIESPLELIRKGKHMEMTESPNVIRKDSKKVVLKSKPAKILLNLDCNVNFPPIKLPKRKNELQSVVPPTIDDEVETKHTNATDCVGSKDAVKTAAVPLLPDVLKMPESSSSLHIQENVSEKEIPVPIVPVQPEDPSTFERQVSQDVDKELAPTLPADSVEVQDSSASQNPTCNKELAPQPADSVEEVKDSSTSENQASNKDLAPPSADTAEVRDSSTPENQTSNKELAAAPADSVEVQDSSTTENQTSNKELAADSVEVQDSSTSESQCSKDINKVLPPAVDSVKTPSLSEVNKKVASPPGASAIPESQSQLGLHQESNNFFLESVPSQPPPTVPDKPESSTLLQCQEVINVDKERGPSENALQSEGCKESETEVEKVTLQSIVSLKPESSFTMTVQGSKTSDEKVPSPGPVSDIDNDMVGADSGAFETFDDSHMSPDDGSEAQYSDSPETTTERKSASSERATYKRKNVIESSSDDDVKRADAGDDTDDADGLERKKGSDEEQNRKSLPFERKRDQEDSRSKKFDKFEHERQRKLCEKKKGKEKSRENVALEDILKEKPLSGSFRIPKKTTGTTKRIPKSALTTPLACTDVPKENMQFEKCRKGNDKDKWGDKDYNYRGRDSNRYSDHNNDFGTGGANANRRKRDHESIQQFRSRFEDKDKDDGRVVVLAPEVKKQDKPSMPSPPRFTSQVEDTEPVWCNDGEELGGGSSSSSSSSDDKNYSTVPSKSEKEPTTSKEDTNNESTAGALGADLNPEVPIECPRENVITVGAVYLITAGDKIDLPDVEALDTKDVTVMKLAWWLSKIDSENAVAVDKSDSICDDNSDDEGGGGRNFLTKLNFTESDEDELFPSGSSDPRRYPYAGLVAEFCGRQLLAAEYRSGPGDKFQKIFILRGGATYDKENFQARCTLCDCLVIGKRQLADHVNTDTHKSKMSSAGLDDVKCDKDEVSLEKKNGDDKTDRAKLPDVVEKKSESKKKETVSISRSRSIDGNRDKKEEDDTKEKETKTDKHKSSEKRKRSKDRASDEGTRKSKDDNNKSGAKSDKKHSHSRANRSRSRSPRHKRTRSRSPRRRSKSPKGQGHRRRSPVERIPREPHRESQRAREPHREPQRAREPRRRSTSAERVQKFLEKTNRRRSRSPSKDHSRKRRRSRSKSPTIGLPRRDNKEFHEKLMLTAEGKWTDEMEQRWKLMEIQEAIFMEQFGEKKKTLSDSPETHPNYPQEWEAFWEKRYGEVQKDGLDPDVYDYVPEWKEVWSKRIKSLLDAEYEKGINEIKVSNGMDLDSLRKIRIAKETAFTVAPATTGMHVPPQPSPASTPQDLATPSTPSSVSVPVYPPNPTAVMVPPAVLPKAKSIRSNVSGNGDDYTARSMSISDGGDNQSVHSANVTSPNGQGVKTPAPTANDIISAWERLKSSSDDPVSNTTRSGDLPPRPTPSSISTSKNNDNISTTGSSSIASYDFDGFELTEVLRIMSSSLEDQLSFFADKVKEYFKKAEEFDLKKKNKSLLLLDEEDFVVMLFNIRDRFMAMIRANILSKDVLKNLNFTVYALNSILEAPQCQKHRSKVTSLTASFDMERNESDLLKVYNSEQKKPSASPPVSRNPLMNVASTMKEKIAVLVAGFLMNMGRDNLSDAELKELLQKIIPSVPGRDRPKVSKASVRDGPERSSVFIGVNSNRPREQNSMTKTCSVVTASGAGTAAPMLTLPDVIVPKSVSMHDRGPLGCMEDVWRNSSSREVDVNISSSESERRSPFSRRGGNNTSNPYRNMDQSTFHEQRSAAQTEHGNQYRISAIDDVGIGSSRTDQEITLGQVTKISQNHAQLSVEPKANARLVSGLRNIIQKEMTSKEVPNSPVQSSEDGNSRRVRHRKRRRKRERRHKSSNSSSSSDSSQREVSPKRRRKKKKRDVENKYKKGTSNTAHSSRRDNDASSLRENNQMARRSGQSTEEPEQIRPSSQPELLKFVHCNLPNPRPTKTFVLTPWDTLSDISSVGDSMKKIFNDPVVSVPQCTASTSSSKEKVKSVSKTFWTEDAEENKLSSISSNDEVEPAKEEPQNANPSRQYRVIAVVEKEPGEITDSSSSQ